MPQILQLDSSRNDAPSFSLQHDITVTTFFHRWSGEPARRLLHHGPGRDSKLVGPDWADLPGESTRSEWATAV